jgi:hypothetical protein
MGIAQKDRGGAERHRKANVSPMAFGVLWRRTLPKSPEGSGMSRHLLEQTNLQERGGPNRRCKVSDMHQPLLDMRGRASWSAEIVAKSSCDWANLAERAGDVLFWDCPT